MKEKELDQLAKQVQFEKKAYFSLPPRAGKTLLTTELIAMIEKSHV